MNDRPVKKIGPWTVQSSAAIYDNPWIRVTDHKVLRPDGSPGQYGVVHFKHRAVGVLPIDADGMVHLVGQHRFPHDTFSWELPEGGGALSEDPQEAARRELLEETGLRARSWLAISECDLSNSVTDEKAACFLAWDLESGPASPEPEEALSYRRLSFSALHDQVLTGQIRDSLTIIMVLTVHALAIAGRAPSAVADLILGRD